MAERSQARADRVAKRFEPPLLVAALLTVPAVVIQASSTNPDAAAVAEALDWVIWLAFLAESVTMIWISPDRRGWMRHHVLEIALVLFTPPFGPAALQGARVLRLLRLLRLVVAGSVMRRLVSPEGLRQAALFTLLLILAAAGAFQAVENGHHPQPITLWDGLWWAVETVTTVGYGDIYPVTDAGRVIAMIVMLSGIGFVALLTGSIAQRFLSGSEAEQREDELMGHLRDISARLERLERLDARDREPPTPAP